MSGFYELICDKTMIYMVEVLEDNGIWAYAINVLFCCDMCFFFFNFSLSCACGSRYVLGAVETFLKAVPAAGIFRGCP